MQPAYEPDDGPLSDAQVDQIRKLNMNDKIKQLLEQSGFRYVKDDGIGWAGNYNSSLPKFAGMLIDAVCDDMLSLEPMYPANIVALKIKQKYGVSI